MAYLDLANGPSYSPGCLVLGQYVRYDIASSCNCILLLQEVTKLIVELVILHIHIR